MIYKYVPIHIESVQALQVNGDDVTEVADLSMLVGDGHWCYYNGGAENELFMVDTGPSYSVVVHIGDYVVKDESGKIRVMNSYEFNNTYRRLGLRA